MPGDDGRYSSALVQKAGSYDTLKSEIRLGRPNDDLYGMEHGLPATVPNPHMHHAGGSALAMS